MPSISGRELTIVNGTKPWVYRNSVDIKALVISHCYVVKPLGQAQLKTTNPSVFGSVSLYNPRLAVSLYSKDSTFTGELNDHSRLLILRRSGTVFGKLTNKKKVGVKLIFDGFPTGSLRQILCSKFY